MAEVVALFRASRWVADWEALGGRLHLGGDWLRGPDGSMLLEMQPPLGFGDPRLRRLQNLRSQIALGSRERAAVIDFLLRRDATRGLL